MVAGAKPQRSVNYANEVLQGKAVSLPSARKRAREISEHCVYGSMELLDIEMEA